MQIRRRETGLLWPCDPLHYQTSSNSSSAARASSRIKLDSESSKDAGEVAGLTKAMTDMAQSVKNMSEVVTRLVLPHN